MVRMTVRSAILGTTPGKMGFRGLPALLAACVLLGACGQKGPLFMPVPPVQKTSVPVTENEEQRSMPSATPSSR
jgi:predicted small lipoprotein YifL